MLTGLVLSVGCGGGGGSSWVGALLGAIAVVAIISASGGSASPLVFAADLKSPAAEIRFAETSTRRFRGRIGIFGQTPKLVDLIIIDDKNLKLETELSDLTPGSKQVMIEVVPEGSEEAIFKAIAASDVEGGLTDKVDTNVNYTTTAKVLAFEQWDGKTTNTFAEFNPTADSIASLAEKLEAEVLANFVVNGEIVPVATFTYSATIDTEAEKVADATPVPTDEGTPVPATRILDVDVTQPNTQVEVAVSESLKTLVESFRTSVRPSVSASVVPAGVPGLGSNDAVNINWLMGNLLAALPTGGNISNGVMIDSTDNQGRSYQVATYTGSTLEVTSVGVIANYSTFPPTFTQYVKQTTKISGCAATVDANGILSQLSIEAGSKVETTSYKDDGSPEGSIEITMQSGVKIEMSNNLTADTGFYVFNTFGDTSWGLIKSLSGTEVLKVTFTGRARFDVTVKEAANTTTGTITMDNLTGSYTVSSAIIIGVDGSKVGAAAPVANVGAQIRKEWPNTPETHTNALVFAGNTFNFGFSVNWNNGDITLENGLIELKNLTKQPPAAGETSDANYSFSDAAASMLVKYNGTDFAKYGYISSLKFTISNMSFNPATPDAAGNGTVISIDKTNSDRTIDKLSYIIEAQKPVLQTGSDSKFAGGNEKVTVSGGVTTIEGAVVVARTAAAAEKLTLNYTSQKQVNGSINAKVIVTQGASTKTLFFTRQTTRAISGNLYEGEQATDSGAAAGTISVTTSGAGTLNYNGTSNFRVEL